MNPSIAKPARIGLAGIFSTLAACAALMVAPGCDSSDPCQDYVDYVCDCGSDTCDDVRNTYEGADAKLQDECENELQDLQQADKAADEECAGVGSSDTGA